MKIKKVVFKNFKTYCNETVFNFSSNINVLMGNNGNGKTSFLEGISLAFYGCKMFNSNFYTNEYVEFVVSRLSRNGSGNIIELFVEYEDEDTIYSIIRKYEVANNEIESEEFEVREANCVVDSSRFLERFDYAIMEQFFLNGEKINDLIKEDKIDTFLQTFINTAFNIKVFNQIGMDLERIEKRELKALKNNEHKVLESEVKNLSDKLDSVEKQISKNNNSVNVFSQQLKSLKKELSKKSIGVGDELQELIENNEKLSRENNDLDKKLKDLMLNGIQYLLHKKELKSLVDKLNSNRELRIAELQDIYSSFDRGEVSLMPINYMSLELELALIRKNMELDSFDYDGILDFLREISAKKSAYSKNRSKINNTNEGKKQLDVIQDYEQLENDIERLQQINLSLHEEKERIDVLLIEKQKELDKCMDNLIKYKVEDNLASEKTKLKNIVEKYARIKHNDFNQIIAKKSLEILKVYFLRKKGLIDDICISGNKLEVYKDSKIVNYSNFSAGEQQMLVISLIFAIIEVAKVDIPLVLDSFVGRLDIAHTNSILKYLKRSVSSQIILLSTDSELGEREISKLRDSSIFYKLENDGFSTTIDRVNL